MTTVFLIRHGESQSNRGEPTTGPERALLTPLGKEQAIRVANFLKSYDLDLIVTSPYLRAKQMAELLTDMSKFDSVPREPWEVQEFTYLSPLYQQRSTIQERRPLVEAYWEQRLPFFEDGPGAESFAQFLERVKKFRKRLQDTSYNTIAVFSHEQFINAFLWLIKKPGGVEASAPQAMQEFRMFLDRNPLPNGAIVQVKVHHNQVPWSYELITDHLLAFA